MERSRLRGWLLVASLSSLVAACREDARLAVLPDSVLLVVPDDTDDLGARQAAITAQYLTTISGHPVEPLRVSDDAYDSLDDLADLAARRRAGLVVVLEAERLATDRVAPARLDALGESGFVLETHDVGGWANALDDEPGATLVLTAAAERLPRQYATYELLRRLGARFFHPEHEYVPTHARADLRPLARRPTALHRDGADYRPDFEWRSWSFHSPHPLEHLEAFSDPDHPIDEAVRVNDWVVKNFGNRFRGAGRGAVPESARAVRAEQLDALRRQLGFPRGSGISLHNLQQGASAEIDPDADVPVRQQIESRVADKLAAVPDARWFTIHFGPTEFTTTPDEQTVRWLDWAGQAALRLRPDIEVEINNHTTGRQPSPNFDDLGCPNGTNAQSRVDYYDLAFHTDPRLGVSVHTVMFYPLEGPARVYNQESFAHKRCLMQRASSEGRSLRWFPEGAWWLSFDNAVPMYLPLYLYARARDIELLRPLLPRNGGTLTGHRMFNSGHEWGYWQQDYLVGLMSWNAELTLPTVLGELFDPLCEPDQWREGCPARTDAITLMMEIIEHQRALFLEREDWRGRPGGVYAYFAGEDEGDELAASSGFEFRPVRVSFREVAGWDADARAHFRATDLAALHEAAAAYRAWSERLRTLAARVPEAGRPWLDEVRDGVEIDGLRAAHTAALYESVLRMAEAEHAGDPRPGQAGYAAWSDARARIGAVLAVIDRREKAYRYPHAQTHGGGLTPAHAVDNGTTYPYRVHTKTHLLSYWINRQSRVAALLVGQGSDPARLRLREAIDGVGAPLDVTWPSLSGLAGEIEIGEQTVGLSQTTIDLGDAPGYWPVRGELRAGGAPIPVQGGVARSDVLASTPARGMTLRNPDDPPTQGVLSSVMPPLRWAWIPEPMAVVMGPDDDADGTAEFDQLVYAPVIEGDAADFRTAAVSFELPVALAAGGTPLFITVANAELSGRVADGGFVHPVVLDGELSVDDIVEAAIELAGFDEAGTLALLADVWGFDPAQPPQWVPIEAELTIE